MSKINLVFAPDPVYNKKSTIIDLIDDQVIDLSNQMLDFTVKNNAYGVAAPMFGISKQIIIVNMDNNPIIMINPEILSYSSEKETMSEESFSFTGINVEVERSKKVELKYLDLNNQVVLIEAEGIFARIIQHEYDYLIGKNILSYVSKLKADMLTKKMLKYKKSGHLPHIHSSSCNH